MVCKQVVSEPKIHPKFCCICFNWILQFCINMVTKVLTLRSTDPSATLDSSSILMRVVMSNSRSTVELFDSNGHFGVWQDEVLDTLFQQGQDIAIEKMKPNDVDDKDGKTINLWYMKLFICVSPESRSTLSRIKLLHVNYAMY